VGCVFEAGGRRQGAGGNKGRRREEIKYNILFIKLLSSFFYL
jgi:hypothetical protein